MTFICNVNIIFFSPCFGLTYYNNGISAGIALQAYYITATDSISITYQPSPPL